MRCHVQLKIDRTNFIGAAAVVSLHDWELICSWDLREERLQSEQELRRTTQGMQEIAALEPR